MHKIVESISIESQDIPFTGLSEKIKSTYNKLAGNPDNPQWKTELFLRGYVGGYVNEELHLPINLSILDNGCVRVIPETPVKSVEVISADTNEIIDYLKKEDVSLRDIDSILANIKFNFGYFINKSKKAVYINCTSKCIEISYEDLTNFDMLELSKRYGKSIDSLNENLGGTEVIGLIKGDPRLEVSQTGDKYKTIRINIEETDLKLGTKFFKLKLDELGWLADPTIIYPKMGLVCPDFSKGYLSSEEKLRVLLVRFILEITSNISAHNYKDYSEVYAIKFEGVDLPFIIPKGYEGGINFTELVTK